MQSEDAVTGRPPDEVLALLRADATATVLRHRRHHRLSRDNARLLYDQARRVTLAGYTAFCALLGKHLALPNPGEAFAIYDTTGRILAKGGMNRTQARAFVASIARASRPTPARAGAPAAPRRHRARPTAAASGRAPDDGPPRRCAGCGEPFTPKRPNQLHHGETCRQRARRKRLAEFFRREQLALAFLRVSNHPDAPYHALEAVVDPAAFRTVIADRVSRRDERRTRVAA